MRVEEVSHDPEKPVSRRIGEASGESAAPVTISITEIALQKLIDALPKAPKHSKFSFLAHPLIVVLVGSLAGTLVGSALTYIYTNRTQAIVRRQSLLDGINNTRVPKLGELWEQLDTDDLAIDQLLEQSTKTDVKNPDEDAKVHQIVEILKKDRLLVGRNRFWLGASLFKKTDDYLDQTIQICLSSIGDKNPDLTELRQKKDAARQDILRIRDSFVEGNSNY
jgi:hypothetical protein